MGKIRLMKRIYNSKIFWMVISLLASLCIWVYVTSVETEEYKQTFNIVVDIVGEDILRDGKNLVITDQNTNTVEVEIVGPRRVVSSLSATKLKAQVDVSKLSQSAYTSLQYTVVYPDGIDKTNVRESRKTPDTVSFMVSSLTQKTIPIRGSFDGHIADGFTGEMPVFEPSSITISGPETYVRDVSYAWVTFGSDTVSSTYSVETGFTLMNDMGEKCSSSGISCSTDLIKATLPILEVKEVPLAVNLIYGAGANESNVKVTIEPKTVTLAGDSAILDTLNMITLDTIDLTDFASTFTDTYTIAINNELTNLAGVSEATVTIEIVGLETKTFTVKNLSCINVTDGFSASVISESLTVVLRGTPEQLRQVKSENIWAVADLVDYNESGGTFMAEVKVRVDGYTDVGAINPGTITIEIKRS